MARKIMQPQKRGRGRPATGKGTPVQVRLQPDLLGALDKFIREEKRDLSRPEAIRELLADNLVRLGAMKPSKA